MEIHVISQSTCRKKHNEHMKGIALLVFRECVIKRCGRNSRKGSGTARAQRGTSARGRAHDHETPRKRESDERNRRCTEIARAISRVRKPVCATRRNRPQAQSSHTARARASPLEIVRGTYLPQFQTVTVFVTSPMTLKSVRYLADSLKTPPPRVTQTALFPPRGDMP